LLGHHFWRHAYREGKRGRCVAKIVKSDVRQTRFPQERFEMLLDEVLFVNGFAVRGCEDQIDEY
jgi:hypothetical protein